MVKAGAPLMNKLKKTTIFTLTGMLLSACTSGEGQGTNGENGDIPEDITENWQTYVVEAEEQLESYTTEIDLSANVELAGQTNENSSSFIASVIGDFERGHVIVTNEENGEIATNEMFFEGSTAYINEGTGWVDVSGDEPVTSESSYHHVLNSVVEVADFLEAELSGDELTLHYEGNDQEVWDAFETPFSLSISGFSMEELTITLEVIVNAQTSYMNFLDLDIQADNDLSEVHLKVTSDYYDHDEIDEFEVEREINEELGL